MEKSMFSSYSFHLRKCLLIFPPCNTSYKCYPSFHLSKMETFSFNMNTKHNIGTLYIIVYGDQIEVVQIVRGITAYYNQNNHTNKSIHVHTYMQYNKHNLVWSHLRSLYSLLQFSYKSRINLTSYNLKSTTNRLVNLFSLSVCVSVHVHTHVCV